MEYTPITNILQLNTYVVEHLLGEVVDWLSNIYDDDTDDAIEWLLDHIGVDRLLNEVMRGLSQLILNEHDDFCSGNIMKESNPNKMNARMMCEVININHTWEREMGYYNGLDGIPEMSPEKELNKYAILLMFNDHNMKKCTFEDENADDILLTMRHYNKLRVLVKIITKELVYYAVRKNYGTPEEQIMYKWEKWYVWSEVKSLINTKFGKGLIADLIFEYVKN